VGTILGIITFFVHEIGWVKEHKWDQTLNSAYLGQPKNFYVWLNLKRIIQKQYWRGLMGFSGLWYQILRLWEENDVID